MHSFFQSLIVAGSVLFNLAYANHEAAERRHCRRHVYHNGLFFNSYARLTRREAHEYCERKGMKLANINVFNFDTATEILDYCVGDFSQAWIGSYATDHYMGTCLALFTGVGAPGGSVNPMDCDRLLPVFCSYGDNHNHHHNHHHRRPKTTITESISGTLTVSLPTSTAFIEFSTTESLTSSATFFATPYGSIFVTPSATLTLSSYTTNTLDTITVTLTPTF